MLPLESFSELIVDAYLRGEEAEPLLLSVYRCNASVLEFMSAVSVPCLAAIAGSPPRSRVVREPPFEPGWLVMTSGMEALLEPYPGLVERCLAVYLRITPCGACQAALNRAERVSRLQLLGFDGSIC